jgi:ABC-2 type transport system ATP-binding protein
LRDVQTTCDDVVILYRGQVKLHQSIEQLNKPSSPTTFVHFHGNGEEFTRRLSRSGVEVVESSPDVVQLYGIDQALIDTVWRNAAELGVVIQSVMPARNSLEEVFMNTVREDANAS